MSTKRKKARDLVPGDIIVSGHTEYRIIGTEYIDTNPNIIWVRLKGSIIEFPMPYHANDEVTVRL